MSTAIVAASAVCSNDEDGDQDDADSDAYTIPIQTLKLPRMTLPTTAATVQMLAS